MIEQLIATLKIKEKYNLMPLFREISFLHDEELQEILAEHRFHEITWLKTDSMIFMEKKESPIIMSVRSSFGTFQYLSFIGIWLLI